MHASSNVSAFMQAAVLEGATFDGVARYAAVHHVRWHLHRTVAGRAVV